MICWNQITDHCYSGVFSETEIARENLSLSLSLSLSLPSLGCHCTCVAILTLFSSPVCLKSRWWCSIFLRICVIDAPWCFYSELFGVGAAPVVSCLFPEYSLCLSSLLVFLVPFLGLVFQLEMWACVWLQPSCSGSLWGVFGSALK